MKKQLLVETEINSDSAQVVCDAFVAYLNDLGVIEVNFNGNNIDLTLADMMELREAVKKLGDGDKIPILVRPAEFCGITPDARKYSATRDSGKYTLASAVMVKTLASRILLNFYLNINKPIIPTKGFLSEKEAYDWLLNFKN